MYYICQIDGDQGEERVDFDLGKAFDNLYLNKYGTEPLGELYIYLLYSYKY